MESEIFKPRRELAGLVEGIWDAQTSTSSFAAPLRMSILPIPAVSLAFQYGCPVQSTLKGRADWVRSTVAGIRDSALAVAAGGGADVIVVKLTQLGARRFFRPPPNEFANLNLDLRLVLPPAQIEALESQLAEASSSADRIALVESFLIAHLNNIPADPLVACGMARLRAGGWGKPITALARDLGIGGRQLERRFLEATGATPKRIARILRFMHALQEGVAGKPWAQVAQQAGFFDQAHLVREFVSMTGNPPRRFLESAVSSSHRHINEQLGATVFSNTFFI